MRKNKLESLRILILKDEVTRCSKNSPLFGGADISIVSKLPDVSDDFYGNPQYVVTKYTKELSWLIFQLKEIYKEDLDYINKYPFYGRLAERANKSIQNNGEDLLRLLMDVLEEAEEMNPEIE